MATLPCTAEKYILAGIIFFLKKCAMVLHSKKPSVLFGEFFFHQSLILVCFKGK